jgi:hypothetical protein
MTNGDVPPHPILVELQLRGSALNSTDADDSGRFGFGLHLYVYTLTLDVIPALKCKRWHFNHPHKRRVRTVPADAPTAFAI